MKTACVLALATGSATAFTPARNAFGARTAPAMMASGSTSQIENRNTQHPALGSVEPGATMSDPWFPDAVSSVTPSEGEMMEEKKLRTEPEGVPAFPSKVKEVGYEGPQDFLEASPYADMSNIPVNTFKPKAPFTGKIRSVKRIVGPKATGETCDIVIEHGGKMPYWEGQSFGVIPPGKNPKNGKPNSVRLYSIASTRYGDDMTGATGTLCVRRATYWCPEMGKEDPAKKGICSNYLCDAKAGDEVKMTGPSGKVMLLPESDPSTDIIMVATGTGIAPYRSFIRRLFTEKTPYGADFSGLAWLFLGVANSDALLYDEDWQKVKKDYPDNFRVDYALSREATNKKGGKMYIQDKVEEYAEEIFDRLDKGAHIYFCGLKGMMPGIQDMLKDVCDSKKLDYEEYITKLKKAGQWHVEVY